MHPSTLTATPAGLAPTLPAWLEAGLQGCADHITVTAQRAYRLRAVQADTPALIVLLEGIKRAEVDGRQVELGCGEFLVVHHACRMAVENLPPSGSSTGYRAWVVAFPWHVVAVARTLQGQSVSAAPLRSQAAVPISSGNIEPLLPAVRAYLSAMAPGGELPNAAQRDHALIGLLLALARAGHDHFLQAQDPSLAARIRQLVAQAPARNWSSSDFEAALNISGATLRRRLTQEETSLRVILKETRLHHGLGLLQTSRRPLKSIALACGYQSLASFSRGFAELFGVAPGAVANA